jgi:hypothetical protein
VGDWRIGDGQQDGLVDRVPAGYRIDLFAEQDSFGADDLIALWTRESQIDEAEAQRRVSEVLLVGGAPDGTLAAISTAYIDRDPVLELDVWNYIETEGIDLPEIYYAHEREVFQRQGMWLAPGEWGGPNDREKLERRQVRYRTVGDMSCTGAVDSDATDVRAVIEEIIVTRITERGATRADDKLGEAAMEDRKREGYF